MWRAEAEAGLKQVGGNVGRGQMYPFAAFEDGSVKPGVLDAFLAKEWTFYSVRKLRRYISYAIL